MRRMFKDRYDAGRQLARALEHLRNSDPVILALPRGGVPVGFEVAISLNAELDVLFVRKIGVPGYEELALGAIVDGAHPQLVFNEEVLRMVNIPPGYIEAEMDRQLAEIERRRRLYLGDAEPVEVTERVAVIVDDGIATGATIKAALRGVRRNEPRRLVLAVPVAPRSTIEELAGECDEAVALEMPEPFYAVGHYYADFTQTTDEEVMELLAKARKFRAQAQAVRPP